MIANKKLTFMLGLVLRTQKSELGNIYSTFHFYINILCITSCPETIIKSCTRDPTTLLSIIYVFASTYMPTISMVMVCVYYFDRLYIIMLYGLCWRLEYRVRVCVRYPVRWPLPTYDNLRSVNVHRTVKGSSEFRQKLEMLVSHLNTIRASSALDYFRGANITSFPPPCL